MPALEFRIDLSGNLVQALNKGGDALEKTGEQAKHAKHEFELFEAETGKLSGSLGGLEFNLAALGKGGSLFTFDLAEGLHSAYEIVESLVDKFIELGKEVVGVAGRTQDLNLAIKLNVGDEKAKEIDELAESFERTTRFNANDMKRALLPLLKQGVGDKDTLDAVATIATDLAARNAGGIQDVQQSISAFAGIFQRGRLKPQQLAQFGIQANDYFKELASSLGVSVESAAKLAKAGKVSQDKLAAIAVNMIAKRQGGAIGGPSLEAAKTLGATIERLGSLKDVLFEKLANSEAMKKVQATLDRFIATMKGEAGDRLIAQLGNVFERVADWLSPQRIQSWVDGLSHVGEKFEMVKGILGEIVTVAEEFAIIWSGSKLLGGISTVASILSSQGLLGGITALRTGLNAALSPVAALTIAFEAWRYAFEKISKTIEELGGLRRVAQDFKDWISGNNGSGVAQDAPNANSPQWKKDAWAKKNAIQLAGSIPMMASGGCVSGPTLALIGEAGPEAVVPLSDPSLASTGAFGRGRGGGDVTIQIGGIHVDVTAGGGDAQHVGLVAAQTVRVELKKFLDEAGWAYGATVLE